MILPKIELPVTCPKIIRPIKRIGPIFIRGSISFEMESGRMPIKIWLPSRGGMGIRLKKHKIRFMFAPTYKNMKTISRNGVGWVDSSKIVRKIARNNKAACQIR